MWSPDVYEGSPTSVTILFAVVPKIGLFVVFSRLLFFTFYDLIGVWQNVLIVVSLLSITIGTFGALRQYRIKRFLAFSSITHVGYLLIAFSTGTFEGLGAPIFRDETFEVLGSAVRKGRTVQDGTFESLGSVGVNNLEFVRSSGSACFVYNPTVRRRGGVGIQTCYVGPTPRTPVFGGGSLGPMWGPLPLRVPVSSRTSTETKRRVDHALWLK